MIRKVNYKLLCLLFLFGAHLLSASGRTEGDSTKSKYPITDPRNPNCPCHKYQQKADEEYARLLKEQGVNRMEAEATGLTFGSSKKPKKVRSRHWFFYAGRAAHANPPRRKGFRDKLSRCFHF